MDKLLCQFSHHRCASTWINNIMRDLCRTLGFRFAVVHRTDQLGEDPEGFIHHHRINFLVLSNADYSLTDRLPPFRGFHVIRDPRDIAVSSYFSHLVSHPVDDWPELADHRKELAAMDKREGLLWEIRTCRNQQFREMENWNYRDPRIVEWKMEDIIRKPAAGFNAILKFLGFNMTPRSSAGTAIRSLLNRIAALAWHIRFGHVHGAIREPGGPLPVDRIPAKLLEETLHRHRFVVKSGGRAPGHTDVSSHYRCGQPEDWKNHLERVHLDALMETYPGLLQHLGYGTGI